jgi:hypothetical protein
MPHSCKLAKLNQLSLALMLNGDAERKVVVVGMRREKRADQDERVT